MMIFIQCLAVLFHMSAALMMARGTHKLLINSYLLWALGSGLWIMVGMYEEVYGLVALNIFFLIVDIISYFKWKRRNVDKSNT